MKSQGRVPIVSPRPVPEYSARMRRATSDTEPASPEPEPREPDAPALDFLFAGNAAVGAILRRTPAAEKARVPTVSCTTGSAPGRKHCATRARHERRAKMSGEPK